MFIADCLQQFNINLKDKVICHCTSLPTSFVVVSEITKEFMEIITSPPGSLVTGSMQFHSVA